MRCPRPPTSKSVRVPVAHQSHLFHLQAGEQLMFEVALNHGLGRVANVRRERRFVGNDEIALVVIAGRVVAVAVSTRTGNVARVCPRCAQVSTRLENLVDYLPVITVIAAVIASCVSAVHRELLIS